MISLFKIIPDVIFDELSVQTIIHIVFTYNQYYPVLDDEW